MLAARLAENGRTSILLNATPDFGLGVAYSTSFEGHLLNVRSGRMSAVESGPDEFVHWLAVHRPEFSDPVDFAPRKLFGDYVRDRLAHVDAAHPGLIRCVVGRACAIKGQALLLEDGRTFVADAIVLATGNPAPSVMSGGGSGGSRIIENPWAAEALDRICENDSVLILGTGLTMVDVIQTLVARGWKGRATALSRRGLLPRAHASRADQPADLPPAALSGPISERLATARALVCAGGWRSVMEAYRPITADLWMTASPDQRSRLVRHLRPWWDVHRHRIAPRIALALETLKADRRLILLAGRLGKAEEGRDTIRVAWIPRGSSTPRSVDACLGPPPLLTAAWLIDCTGPAHSAATDPLTAPLITEGRARLDPLRMGLDIDGWGRVRHADGTADPSLLVLGPPARAAFWETIAVPDIRKRIEDMVVALG